MRITRRHAIGGALGIGAAGLLHGTAGAAPPRFTPDWGSLVGNYRAPDWYRDAKFGIWAHWTAQCVPEFGDWYARCMYLQGDRCYDHHLKHYGHPADRGFMELDHAWKAERWEPGRLLDLYQRAGARYFVALANHHDNLDTFASTHHAWNTTRIGPKKDIVGTWAKLARARGLRFGVSNHSAHTWHWFQPAYGYDLEGSRKGERYDAFNLTAADGKGTWWEGLDPQQLYGGCHMVMPGGLASIADANQWHDAHDLKWTETPPPGDPGYVRQWSLRCRELVDKYRPDLLYFDDWGLPLGQAGLDMAAHVYNASAARTGGRVDAVVTAKNMPADRAAAVVEDVERGGKDAISPLPWQTDTCIGNWHYDRALYNRDGYKSAATVIHTLCDVVSKNGNLLLSVPLRGDGTIDEKEEAIVTAIGDWMGRYGDAIYGSRPWRTFGEGSTRIKAGQFAEGGKDSPYTARDVRYVTKAGALHALVLGWPDDGVVRLTALGSAAARVARATLSGDAAPLAVRHVASTVEVTLPEARRDPVGTALILSGEGMTA